MEEGFRSLSWPLPRIATTASSSKEPCMPDRFVRPVRSASACASTEDMTFPSSINWWTGIGSKDTSSGAVPVHLPAESV